MKYNIPKEFEKRPAIQGVDLTLIVIVGLSVFIGLLLLVKGNVKGFILFLFLGVVSAIMNTKFKEKGSLIFFITHFFKPKYIKQNTKIKFLIIKNVNHEEE